MGLDLFNIRNDFRHVLSGTGAGLQTPTRLAFLSIEFKLVDTLFVLTYGTRLGQHHSIRLRLVDDHGILVKILHGDFLHTDLLFGEMDAIPARVAEDVDAGKTGFRQVVLTEGVAKFLALGRIAVLFFQRFPIQEMRDIGSVRHGVFIPFSISLDRL